MDLFENAVFLLLSCGRLKTELFENAGVTASIYKPSEHALGSFWITRMHFVICFRISNIIAFSCGRVDWDIFYADEKDSFSKFPSNFQMRMGWAHVRELS